MKGGAHVDVGPTAGAASCERCSTSLSHRALPALADLQGSARCATTTVYARSCGEAIICGGAAIAAAQVGKLDTCASRSMAADLVEANHEMSGHDLNKFAG